MSKIFDALRKAESSRPTKSKMPSLYEISTVKKDRRRSRRRDVRAAIQVYGHLDGQEPFYEEARSINVSKHGALLKLHVPVREGQKLLLFVGATEKMQVCEIVATRSRDGQSLQVAVTFAGVHTESQRAAAASPKLERLARRSAALPVI